MRSSLVCLGALWLAACGGMQEVSEPTQTLGPPLQSFAGNGRISLRQGERSDHLQFDWQHAPERDVVLFSSPLGQGLAELGRNASGAWLLVPGEPERRAPDLGALTQRLFGAPLPLDVLAEWLRGARPALSGEVDGWRIVVTETAPFGQRRLPRRLEVRRDDIELRIVIDGWSDGG
ncbi:MAG: outer membrane lipoprotein LolB [Sulfuritalea sp.]|nr:outer membrane lipoprotein LolB [Sulfuritalea sp.]